MFFDLACWFPFSFSELAGGGFECFEGSYEGAAVAGALMFQGAVAAEKFGVPVVHGLAGPGEEALKFLERGAGDDAISGASLTGGLVSGELAGL